jgi:predicted ATPase
MSESPRLIQHLKPRNILSFGPECAGIDLGSLNVLIGPNGSGKSNLIEVINLMRSGSNDFQEVTRKSGGVGEWIWKGGGDQAAEVTVTFKHPAKEGQIAHHIGFKPVAQRFELTEETINDGEEWGHGYYATDLGHKGPFVKVFGSNKEDDWISAPFQPSRSVLGLLKEPSRYPELAWLTQSYEKVRIYREWAFGRNTIFREPQQADMRSDVLMEDFSNKGMFLSKLKKSPQAKKVYLEHLRELYEGLTDFEVVAEGGTVQVFLHEGDFAIPATRLSDGTLRYLCLLAILCDPEPPPLICIEEPELGLHPDILPGLADLMRSASERTQLIVTTHSDILVDAMTETPECVIVCEKHEGQTEMKRLDAGELSVWLQKYRLGQLWIDGQLGGKRW